MPCAVAIALVARHVIDQRGVCEVKRWSLAAEDFESFFSLPWDRTSGIGEPPAGGTASCGHDEQVPSRVSAACGRQPGAQSAEQLSLAAVPLVASSRSVPAPWRDRAAGRHADTPFLLLSIPMGLLTDRMPRRRAMLAPRPCALSLLLLLVLVASGRVSVGAGRARIHRRAGHGRIHDRRLATGAGAGPASCTPAPTPAWTRAQRGN